MAGFDVLVLSSDVEGLPVSVMEAKALALPVVATSVGGLPEMIHDGIDGLLVPRQRPSALADALERVLGDDALRARRWLPRAQRRQGPSTPPSRCSARTAATWSSPAIGAEPRR